MVDLTKFKLLSLDKNRSILTNFLTCDENFKRIRSFFEYMANFFSKLEEELDPTKIAEKVQNQVINNKIVLSFNHNLGINQSVHLTVNGYNFELLRTELQTYKITQSSTDTNKLSFEQLILFVKQKNTGIVLYPIIVIQQDYIEITFTESIKTGFNVTIL